MSDAELADVRERVANVSGRLRGRAAIAAGRGIAASQVLDGHPQSSTTADSWDFSAEPVRWIVFGTVQLAVTIAAGASHIRTRSGGLETETAADVALVSTLVAVAMAFIAVRLLPRMSPAMRTATRTCFLVGCVILPLGIAMGLQRILTDQAYEIDVMLRAIAVQTVGLVVMIVLWRRYPGPVTLLRRAAFSDAQCVELRERDPELAQRMKDAEIQALLAPTVLGHITPRLAERESARIDERWGVGLVDGVS
ncbi:hypothetical protein OVN18_06445 [Microcella daejeonensis]|uniref:Uncharacterized protein n=1 Tax=Microcella daejeonensis TaxID=2994971 RepID=A0A9E8MMY6_9MICO|nr:hypothetical protein [Microcella daejeonensis]WAB82635.1 hypothetical protein OVN18_06445 [Microcella daejeonensis]